MSKIKQITISNLKAVADFTANFNGCSAIITGRNNSGKSTVLKSIQQRLNQIKPDQILRRGTDEGFEKLELTTGETFTWEVNNTTKAGERLIYTTKDELGGEIKTAISKEIVKRFFPNYFDIDKFLNESPAEQSKMLQKFSGLDFAMIDARYKTAYEDRTFANRKRDDAQVLLKPVNSELPVDLIDVVPLEVELSGVEAHNKRYNDMAEGAQNMQADNERDGKEVTRLEKLIKTLKADIKGREEKIAQANTLLAKPEIALKTPEIVEAATIKLKEAKEKNVLIVENNKAIESKQAYVRLQAAATEADTKVTGIKKERDDLIKQSNLPDGFGFSESGITYNGFPFNKNDLSSSAIYIAALKIAYMGLGEVKTLHFDCSLLDKENLAQVEDWANGLDLQLMIEKVDFEGGDIQYQLLEKN